MGNGRRFDKEFKEQVVLQILAGEKTSAEMAKELDIHYTTVRDWVKTYRQDGNNAFPGSGHLKPEEEELRKFMIRPHPYLSLSAINQL